MQNFTNQSLSRRKENYVFIKHLIYCKSKNFDGLLVVGMSCYSITKGHFMKLTSIFKTITNISSRISTESIINVTES